MNGLQSTQLTFTMPSQSCTALVQRAVEDRDSIVKVNCVDRQPLIEIFSRGQSDCFPYFSLS